MPDAPIDKSAHKSSVRSHISDIAYAVRIAREESGYSQADLAALAGIDSAMVSRIESGTRSASVKTLKAIAHALDLTLIELLSTAVIHTQP